MKKKTITILTMLFVVLFANVSFANDKFKEAMLLNIKAVYEAKTPEAYQSAINTFERIAEAEKGRWEPYYYQAFGYAMLANGEQQPAKKDTYLDLAMAAVDKGKRVKANESELVALEGFIYMMRVTVDPASRGAKFSGMAFTAYQTAIQMNPSNPRAHAMLAQMQLGTARFFGSSTDEACRTADTALVRFSEYVSDNELAPVWGRGMAESVKKQCK